MEKTDFCCIFVFNIKNINMEQLNQLILGSILGDGYLDKIINNGNSRMTFGHSESQLEYLKYKMSIFNKYDLFNNSFYKNKSISERYKNGYCISYHTKTKKDPLFNTYRNEFYPFGKKILTNKIYELNNFRLAIWFMDDGSNTTSSYQLNSNGFSRNECNILRDMLFKNFNIETSLWKTHNIIYIKSKSAELFKNLISEFIIDSMTYKLKTKYKHKRVLNKSDKLLENPGEDNQQPIQNLNGSGGFND